MAHPGRTPKACEACRAKKFRCVIPPGSESCEACLKKEISCSLQRAFKDVRESQTSEGTATSISPRTPSISPRANHQDATVFSDDLVINFQSAPNESKPGNPGHMWHPSFLGPYPARREFNYFSSPAYVSMQDGGNSPPRFGSYSQLSRGPYFSAREPNVISENILTEKQVCDLVSFFRNNFNHWISLPPLSTTIEVVNYYLDRCPLVLTVCCAVAMRFGKQEIWRAIYPLLSKFLKFHLDSTSLNSSQSIECVQGLTVVSLFASSLSYGEIQFDSWLISGIGIMHMETIRSLGVSFSHLHFRLWNHLTLAHFAAANLTGRRVMVGREDDIFTQQILQYPDANRFDRSVVAQISVLMIGYSYFRSDITYQDFEHLISDWYSQWSYLARQPIIQFIEPVYQYTLFVARMIQVCHENNISLNYCATYNLVGAAIPKLGIAELRHLFAGLNIIVESLLDVVHEAFFPCLSDELHIMGYNAAYFAVLIQHELFARGNALEPDTIVLTRRLADRFRITSQGEGTISYEWAKVLANITAPL